MKLELYLLAGKDLQGVLSEQKSTELFHWSEIHEYIVSVCMCACV